MPHGGYSDDEVGCMHDEISIHIGRTKTNRQRIVFGGDCHAEVASTTADSGAIGRFANPLGVQSSGLGASAGAQRSEHVLRQTMAGPLNASTEWTREGGRQFLDRSKVFRYCD